MSGPGREDGGLDPYGFRGWVVITVPKELVGFMLKARVWGAFLGGDVASSHQVFLNTSQSPEGSVV